MYIITKVFVKRTIQFLLCTVVLLDLPMNCVNFPIAFSTVLFYSRDVAKFIIDDPHWKDSLTMLSVTDFDREDTPFRTLIRHMPSRLRYLDVHLCKCHHWGFCIWHHAGIATCVLDKCSEPKFNYEFVEDIYDFEKKDTTPRVGDSGTDASGVDGPDDARTDPGTDVPETEAMPDTSCAAGSNNGRLVFIYVCCHMCICMHFISFFCAGPTSVKNGSQKFGTKKIILWP